ncbi:hypothetical protein N2152v2_008419 [Parachlorella kessleri]
MADLVKNWNHPRYQKIHLLGSGAHGVCLGAEDVATGECVALKCLPRGKDITKYTSREVINQLRLKHPHIIAIREVFLSDEHLVLVLDLAAGGDLFRHVCRARRLSEDDARWFFQQILFALDYCHRMGVSNRDMKLENVLISDTGPRPIVRLSDFGFSKDENYHSAPGSRVGTPAYLAPEVISNVMGRSYDAKKADVWSCGVMLYVMVAGQYPFTSRDDLKGGGNMGLQASFQRILKAEFKFPASIPMSDECKDLITRMLTKDPARRLSVQEVLQHPWCMVGLEPHLLGINESFVEQSLQELPAPEVLQAVENIVREAMLPGPAQRQQQAATQQPAQQGGNAAYSTDGASMLDDLLEPEKYEQQPQRG